MIAIHIDSSGFRAQMLGLIGQARNPRALMAGVGREAANILKKHFIHKDQTEPNKLGGRREHFWRKVAQSVNAPVVDATGQRVSVDITHDAIAQKVFGGTITAQRVRNLAIPLTAEAYGRSPRVFEQETGLKLFFLRQRNVGLLAAQTGPGLTVEYLLKPSVHQEPDPTALPEERQFEADLLAKAEEIKNRQIENEN